MDSTSEPVALKELAKIYQLLDELEPVERDADVFRPLKPLSLATGNSIATQRQLDSSAMVASAQLAEASALTL